MIFFPIMMLCTQVNYDLCVATLSIYPHRASLKNMPGHGGIRTCDLWNANFWNTGVTSPMNQGNLAENFLKIAIYLTFPYLTPYKISNVYLPEMSVRMTYRSHPRKTRNTWS